MPISQKKYLALFAIALTALGLGLRVAGATGDLWLDEITSLRLVATVHSVGAIFWGINNDNNHFLNSLYLYAIGPDHSFPVLRAFAIVMGTLGIPVAGLVAGGVQQPARAAIGMTLFAVSYPMVHYGSEARGYAGLILAVLLAVFIVRRPDSFANRLYLGLAILFGCACHFLMIPFAMALAAAVFLAALQRLRNVNAALRHAAGMFSIAAMLVGFSALFILGHMAHKTMITGDPYRSPWQSMTNGYGTGLEMLAGFYSPYFSEIAILCAALLFAIFCRRMRALNICLYGLVVFGIPLAIFLASIFMSKLTNFNNPRYYLPSVVVALLMLAECLGLGLTASRRARAVTLAVLACVMTGNTLDLIRFYADGRGHYADAVRAMTARGPATYGLKVPFGVGTVVDFYARHEGVPLTQVAMDEWCETPPDWLVVGSNPLVPFPPVIVRGPQACPQTFDMPVIYAFWGLSGWEWTVYRHRIQQ